MCLDLTFCGDWIWLRRRCRLRMAMRGRLLSVLEVLGVCREWVGPWFGCFDGAREGGVDLIEKCLSRRRGAFSQ